MSDVLSIAAVTETLRNLLFTGVNATVAGTDVTARPLDRARDGRRGNQLNLFLYRTSVNGPLRNGDAPGMQPGETGFAPLPLDLAYLLTAYGAEDDDGQAHRLLGAAMGILHDRALLEPADIQASLPQSNLHEQRERVRVTLDSLNLEEQSKLWTTFQTQYRVSAAYRASVVLLDSQRPTRSATPVLAVGEGGAGPVADPTLDLPFPEVLGVDPPPTADPERPRPFALTGDRLVLRGRRLDGDTVSVSFDPGMGGDPVVVAPVAGSEAPDRLEVDVPPAVRAGFSTVRVAVTTAGERHETNGVSLPVAPTIATPGPIAVTRDAAGHVQLQLDVVPDVVAGQRVRLFAGRRSAEPLPFMPPTGTLDFDFEIDVGEHPLRLRVGDLDSPYSRLDSDPPVPDPTQRLVVT